MNKLREIREGRGMSQRLLSEKVHIAQSLISMVELGNLKPWPKLKRRLARVLKVTEAELFPTEEASKRG